MSNRLLKSVIFATRFFIVAMSGLVREKYVVPSGPMTHRGTNVPIAAFAPLIVSVILLAMMPIGFAVISSFSVSIRAADHANHPYLAAQLMTTELKVVMALALVFVLSLFLISLASILSIALYSKAAGRRPFGPPPT